MPTSPTSRFGPQFSNPFDRQRSTEKIPTLATVSQEHSLLSECENAEASSSSSSPPTSAGWRNRAASIFQSISSSSSNASERSERRGTMMERSGVGMPSGSIQLRSDLNTARRPSYVPKYAASAHMTSMSGRSSVVGHKADAEERLRRDSRMASVAFPRDHRLGSIAVPRNADHHTSPITQSSIQERIPEGIST